MKWAVIMTATCIGLVSDKYEVGVGNYVDHLSGFKQTDTQKSFVNSAVFLGNMIGMVTFGALSDKFGRKRLMVACSILTFLGGACSAASMSVEMLMFSRVILGVGMGGEYPLGATHSAETADEGQESARAVGMFYLFGSGVGTALCPLVVWILLSAGCSDGATWRITCAVGAGFALIGIVLRILYTEDTERLKKAQAEARVSKRGMLKALVPWRRVLIATAGAWFLFDIVEYGLKQNDADIFEAASDDYKDGCLANFFNKLLAIPSLWIAAWLPTIISTKWIQLVGFFFCFFFNGILAIWYPTLSNGNPFLFQAVYLAQLSFQSLNGVSTMAIPADVFPSAIKGAGHGVSAACGKFGAMIGSFVFAQMKHAGHLQGIFVCVTTTSVIATILTWFMTPNYNRNTLDIMEKTACLGDPSDACDVLYCGPHAHGVGEEKAEKVEKQASEHV